jgi:potassium channel LctB
MQAVGLLQSLGYGKLRYYHGGMTDWVENGGAVERQGGEGMVNQKIRRENVIAPVSGLSWSRALDMLGQWSIDRLVFFWFAMIAGFGVIYWAAGLEMGFALQSGGSRVKTDIEGLITAIYFSFVTALSIGYGDVVPVGPIRILAIAEGAAGLLIFGCLISKLVSRRQEVLVEETHRIAFEDRLDRVRTNLHLVLADLDAILEICGNRSALSDQALRRLESTVRVFCGELQTIHDLLYRTQLLPEEQSLESVLANLAVCMGELADLLARQSTAQQRTHSLESSLRSVSILAREICGECVPRAYAPDLKQLMDQIQELARKIA